MKQKLDNTTAHCIVINEHPYKGKPYCACIQSYAIWQVTAI